MAARLKKKKKQLVNLEPRRPMAARSMMGIKGARGIVGDQGTKGDKGEKGESVTSSSSAVQCHKPTGNNVFGKIRTMVETAVRSR